jgi:hypothetical protein
MNARPPVRKNVHERVYARSVPWIVERPDVREDQPWQIAVRNLREYLCSMRRDES